MHGDTNRASHSESNTLAERKASPTSAAIDKHEAAITDLDDLLQRLEKNLAPVLHLAPPQSTGDARPVGDHLGIPVADQIVGLTRRVQRTAEGVDDLIKRLGI